MKKKQKNLKRVSEQSSHCVKSQRSEQCSQCRVMYILSLVNIESCMYIVNETALGCQKNLNNGQDI